MAQSPSSRAKHAATLTGQPPQPRGNGGRAQHAATITGQSPSQPPHGARAKQGAVARNPALAHVGTPRIFPGQVLGAQQLVGQVLHTADGQAFRITGLEVLLPPTHATYVMKKPYGTLPDATVFARRNPSLLLRRGASPAPPWPWNRPQPAPTTFIGPASPKYMPPPFDHKRYIGDPVDNIDKQWNGMGDMLESHALTHASKNKINNAFFRGTRRLNGLAGRQVLSAPRVASGAARVARTLTSSRLARFSSRFGGKIGAAGMALTGGKIFYEITTDNWDAHTVVDGGMLMVTATGLLVTAGAVAAGATAPVWVPIAGAVILIYGIADYAFDVGGKIDGAVGRKSKMWK